MKPNCVDKAVAASLRKWQLQLEVLFFILFNVDLASDLFSFELAFHQLQGQMRADLVAHRTYCFAAVVLFCSVYYFVLSNFAALLVPFEAILWSRAPFCSVSILKCLFPNLYFAVCPWIEHPISREPSIRSTYTLQVFLDHQNHYLSQQPPCVSVHLGYFQCVKVIIIMRA